jgi:sucrose-6F-phosphate phosphohydrolase
MDEMSVRPTAGGGEPARLLATDLDGTFIGDDDAMYRLWRDLDEAGITVAFSTGRHLPSIRAFYEEHGTARRARACVCMVGTEIWRLEDGAYRPVESWSGVIAEGWDRERVVAIVGEVPAAEMQPAEWQSAFKSSWFLEEDAAAGVSHIRRRAAEEGLQVKVVYSAGRFLDLLPQRSGKGEAVRYLAGLLAIPAGNVITCGDTGNDLDMMRPELGFRSIAVGNAAPELAGYVAPGLYHAAASHAAGIREGLEHFGWIG